MNLSGNPSECLSSRIRIYHFKVNMSKLVRKQNCLFSCPSSQFTHHDNTRKVFKVDFKYQLFIFQCFDGIEQKMNANPPIRYLVL